MHWLMHWFGAQVLLFVDAFLLSYMASSVEHYTDLKESCPCAPSGSCTKLTRRIGLALGSFLMYYPHHTSF